MLRIRNMNNKALASIDALYGLMRFVAVQCDDITADHRAQAGFITLTVPSLLKVEISSTGIGKIASV